MACRYEFKGKLFTEEELDDYLLSNLLGVNFSKPESPASLKSGLENSSNWIKGEREKGTGDYISVTKVLDNTHPSNYEATDSKVPEFMAETGISYHKVLEKVIINLQGRREPFRGVDFPTPYHEQWGRRAIKLYHEVFNPDGGNLVMTEVSVANDDKMVWGDIDVLTISPSMEVRIYDLKLGLTDYKPNIKHTSQLQFYKRILNLGNVRSGVSMIDVHSMHVIPVRIDLEQVKPVEGNPRYEIAGHDILQPVLDVDKDTEYFPARDISEAEARTYFKPEINFNDYNRVKQLHQVNFQAFNQTVVELNQDLNYHPIMSAAATIAFEEGEKKFFFINDGKKVYFEHPTAHLYDKHGHAQRMREIREMVSPSTQSGALSDDFIRLMVEPEYSPTLLHGTAKGNAEKFIGKFYKGLQGGIKVVRADSVPGFEQAGNDIVLVYNGFDPETGKFGTVDIIAVSSQDNEGKFEPKRERRTKLGGGIATDLELELLKKSIGLHHLKPMKRTRRNERLLRTGLVAMALKNANPDIRIGATMAANFTNSTILEYAQVNLKELLDNIKLLSHLEYSGAPVQKLAAFDESTKNLLAKEELFDAENYKQSSVSVYFNSIMDALKGTTRDAAAMRKEFKNLIKLGTEEELGKALMEGDEKLLEETLAEIEADNTRKIETIRMLDVRMNSILGQYDNKIELAKNNKEFQLLASAIVQLKGLINDLDMATDISLRQGWISSTGMTGIKLVDSYVELVKASMRRVSMKYLDGYYPEKIKKFKGLFKKDPRYNFLSEVTGDHSKFYDDLFEYIEVPLMDSPGVERVKRRTGRFWPEGSEQWNGLQKGQQDFIRWYKSKVKEAFISMTPGLDEETFRERWGEDWIPYMKSDMANQLFKVWFKGKSSDLTTMEAIKSGVERIKTVHENYDEFMNINSDNMTKLVNLFKNQLKKINPELPGSEYGNEHRLEMFGLKVGVEDGKLYANPEYKDMIETDLERVLDAHAMNSIRYQELSPLIPVYKSIRTAIAVEESSREGNFKFVNLEKMLRVWTEMVVQQKDQVAKNKNVERGIRIVGRFSTSIALGWNLFSQIKNFMAGFGHTGINAMAQSFSEGNIERLKAHRKAYKYAFQAMKGGHRATDKKINAIMTSMAMGDTDAEALLNNLVFKAGGRNFWMAKMINNQIQDYFHRSHMMAAQMEYDGSINAYEEVKEGKWVYNEDMDPRFKTKEGFLLKKAVKERMKEEGTIHNLDDRMPLPYTHRELTKFKRFANDTFEAHNLEEQNIDKAYALARLFGSMRSWLKAKSNRWFQKGHISESEGRWYKQAVRLEDGTVNDQYTWKGEYVEGMAQTVLGTAKQFANLFHGGTFKDVAEHWQGLSLRQRENLYRAGIEFALIGLLVMALRELFDDDERDSLSFALMSSAVDEVYVLQQLKGGGDVFTNPIPPIGIFTRALKNLGTEDIGARQQGAMTFSGPGKTVPFFKDVADDMGLFND